MKPITLVAIMLFVLAPCKLRAQTGFDGHDWNSTSKFGQSMYTAGFLDAEQKACSDGDLYACNEGNLMGKHEYGDVMKEITKLYADSRNLDIPITVMTGFAIQVLGGMSDDIVEAELKGWRQLYDHPKTPTQQTAPPAKKREASKQQNKLTKRQKFAAIFAAAIQGGAAASQEHADHPFESPLGTGLVGAAAANGRKTKSRTSQPSTQTASEAPSEHYPEASIRNITSGGEIIKTNDGSIWEVNTADESVSSTWTVGTQLFEVNPSNTCPGTMLVNKDAISEHVCASHPNPWGKW